MRYRVRHETLYRYTSEVFLEPHTIRLRPRSDSWQRLERFAILINPQPTRLAEGVDAEGNDVAHAWFSGLTDSLRIRTDFEVETLRENPFDFLESREMRDWPTIRYPEDLRSRLAHALLRVSPTGPAVDRLARDPAGGSAQALIPYLCSLSRRINEMHQVVVRPEGKPMHPTETLRAGKGACRDLAVLFVDCCRSAGLAARFVSGYQEASVDANDQQMHAWAQVYVPGGGWRGFDPSLGLAVADRHICVAAAAQPRHAAPVSGSYRGDALALPLEASLSVSSC